MKAAWQQLKALRSLHHDACKAGKLAWEVRIRSTNVDPA